MDNSAAGSSSNLVVSAEPTSDAEDDDADLGDVSIAQSAPVEGEDAEDAEGDGDDEVDEPEDDYNAAWEVLDVARTIYAKMVAQSDDEARDERLCLSECYLALGDVSCETGERINIFWISRRALTVLAENFPQAVLDYTSALEIKSALLPPSSRALASVHYQLATVLEFTPDRRSDALVHVEQALSGFKALQAELASAPNLDDTNKHKEIEEVDGLIGDLEVKIEELKNAPPAEDLVNEGINHLLGQSGEQNTSLGDGRSIIDDDKPVNDLTSMVKRKAPKKVVGKKGQDDEAVNGNGEKRAALPDKTDEPAGKKARIE